ncbi:NACHT domain-containing protein [Zunongwangia sp.]|uniref:NACHT domain-containing protein n=1 Tax=Zunongwangia sp. TaxID=1965325 RepID=UPI003AA8B2CB
MELEKIDYIDNLFLSYNYQLARQSNDKVRVYTLRYGMYHAAEFILFDKEYDISEIKKEYSELGFATDVRILSENEEIEEYLFEGFFIKTPLGNELKNRYKQFVNKQLQNLPEGSTYEYINSSFDLLLQDDNQNIIEDEYYDSESQINIIEKINQLLSNVKGAIFIIIEAPAGFGKTCTANEILNAFSPNECKQLPFFTELSRNREARVFKHILLNEIDEQFPNGIKQNIVIEQITKGRIPLIIDGFDELISKESNKEEVESMLTTIIELLKGDAKIIITSRKTAIFNSDEFLNSIYDSKNEFSLARFEIKEPKIENWLDSDRIEVITKGNFPVSQIANPVLLAYLRNIDFDTLKEYVDNKNDVTLIDKYFDYLLKREQQRQNLKLNSEEQLKIFRKLVRFMSEFNITAESKETIKDFIKDYNQKLIQDSLKLYIAEEKPSIEDLIETLSNHVFLDRKPNGDVGIVNDFILGHLVGENLIYEKYQEHYDNFVEIIPQDFAIKSVDSFKIQNKENKEALWQIYNVEDFNYEVTFYFDLDYNFGKQPGRKYENLYVFDREISNLKFSTGCMFQSSAFSSIIFSNCEFDLSNFRDTSFQNCSFYDCHLINSRIGQPYSDFALFACESNNNFVSDVMYLFENNQINSETGDILEPLDEDMVLRHFFQVDGIKPRARKFSYIKKSLSDYPEKEINKVFDSLKSKGFLHFKDDVGFITRDAIHYLKHK